MPADIALLYPGDRAARDRSDPAESRFAALFEALAAAGLKAEPAVWHPDFADEVERQLQQVRAVQVWCNPIEGGQRRGDPGGLDALLRRVAERGVFVSAHPEAVLRLGTKDVLLAVRGLPFGSDVQRIDSPAQLAAELPGRLGRGPRVLKQQRGHSGIGIWRVELAAGDAPAPLQLREARRGSEAEGVDWDTLQQRMAPYFTPEAGGHLIDQAWLPRLAEGMWRAYLVGDRVAGFGHQAINALYPATPGEAAPPPGPRLYHGPDEAAFARLKARLESGWIHQLREAVGLAPEQLPLLWDCDFLLGEDGPDGQARHVLCEVNVSSVSPFPPSCIPALTAALRQRVAGG